MENDIGYLIVQTLSGGKGIPVAGASVVISNQIGENQTEQILETNSNGQTMPVELYAPSRNNSLKPNQKNNYSIYRVRTDMEGFYPVENFNVPIFGGQTTVQQVLLIPVPVGFIGTPEVINDTEPQDL